MAGSRSSASTRPRSIGSASSTRAYGPGTSSRRASQSTRRSRGRPGAGVHPWEGDLGDDLLALLAQAKLLDLEVGCYVVNEPARMRFLADIGLWGFVTDVPDLAVETLRPT